MFTRAPDAVAGEPKPHGLKGLQAASCGTVKVTLRGFVATVLAFIVLQIAACSNYVPPQSGLPSGRNWMEGGGG